MHSRFQILRSRHEVFRKVWCYGTVGINQQRPLHWKGECRSAEREICPGVNKQLMRSPQMPFPHEWRSRGGSTIALRRFRPTP